MQKFINGILIFVTASLYPAVSYSGEKCQLIVGWMERPSYQYKKLSGKPAGFDIDYIQELAKQFDCEVNFRHMPWHRQAKELNDGDIDLMLGATLRSSNYSEFYRVSNAYRRDPMGFYTLKSNNNISKMKTITEVFENGVRFGITDYEIRSKELAGLVSKTESKGKISILKSINGLLRNLQLRRLDGVILHSAEVDYLRKKNDPLVKDVKLIPQLSFSMTVAIITSTKATGSRELIENINSSIVKLKDNGTHEKLLREHVLSHFEILN